MNTKNWHTLQFKPNSHLIAQQNLRRQNFETFLPLEEVKKHQFGKTRSSLRPLFPGYMFVNVGYNNSLLTKVKATVGVSKLLIPNSEFKSIDENIILELMHRCDKLGKLLPPKELHKGDKIRVLNSPFSEFITKIEHIDNKKRIWVLIDMMGRQSRIQLNPEQIQCF